MNKLLDRVLDWLDHDRGAEKTFVVFIFLLCLAGIGSGIAIMILFLLFLTELL